MVRVWVRKAQDDQPPVKEAGPCLWHILLELGPVICPSECKFQLFAPASYPLATATWLMTLSCVVGRLCCAPPVVVG